MNPARVILTSAILIAIAAIGIGAVSLRRRAADRAAQNAPPTDPTAEAPRPPGPTRSQSLAAKSVPRLVTAPRPFEEQAREAFTAAAAEQPPREPATAAHKATLDAIEARARQAAAGKLVLTPHELRAVTAIHADHDARRDDIEAHFDSGSGQLQPGQLSSFLTNARAKQRALARVLGADRARALRVAESEEFSRLWKQDPLATADEAAAVRALAARRAAALRIGTAPPPPAPP